MITAAITAKEGGFTLKLDGHAGAGVPGYDPVCAAVSALAFAEAALAGDMYARGALHGGYRADMRKGSAHITLTARREQAALVDGACALTVRFLGLLAENFPENIRFTATDLRATASGGREEIYR